jgi:DNA-binding MarR family transcriptional regulator
MADGEIGKSDYVALAQFREALRRFLHFSENAARKEGLTPQQHQTLLAVKGRPDKEWASVTEIADALQVRHNAAVGLVARCETAGLLTRAVHPTDRRVVCVSLTEKGEAVLARLSRLHLGELRHLRAALRIGSLEE